MVEFEISCVSMCALAAKIGCLAIATSDKKPSDVYYTLLPRTSSCDDITISFFLSHAICIKSDELFVHL